MPGKALDRRNDWFISRESNSAWREIVRKAGIDRSCQYHLDAHGVRYVIDDISHAAEISSDGLLIAGFLRRDDHADDAAGDQAHSHAFQEVYTVSVVQNDPSVYRVYYGA